MKENEEEPSEQNFPQKISRREFLKRSFYAAPVIITVLATATPVQASTCNPDLCDPDTCGPDDPCGPDDSCMPDW